MDKIKVKYITLDEIKNIDPSLIKSMTFTDGSVAMVNSDDKEDKNKISENKEINQDIFNQEEKEPDIQNNPNIDLNYDSEEDINKYNNINKNQKINNNQQRIYYTQNQNININKKQTNFNTSNKITSINNDQNTKRNNINKHCYSFQYEKYKKK